MTKKQKKRKTKNEFVCPECGSTKLKMSRVTKDKWHNFECTECGHAFRIKKSWYK